MAKKLTNEEFLQRLRKLGRDDLEPLEEYINAHTKIRFKCLKNNNHGTWLASPTNILFGCGCPKCKKESISEKLSITHEEFIDRHKDSFNKNIEIIGRYERNNIPILVRCKKEISHQWLMSCDDLIAGGGCPFCRGLRVDQNNCVASIRPDLIKYFKNKEDSFKYTLNSSKKVQLKCPDCGYEKTTIIHDLTKRGFSCPMCGDGISYPNKFIRNMLNMLEIAFESEWSNEKCKGCFYDVKFELNNKIYLIEMDGAFHYSERGYGNLKEVREKDKIKEQKAKENNWILIRIEATISEPDYLFNNIKNSLVGNLFNLKDFDYIECGKRSEKSLVIEVCDYINENITTTITETAKIFKLNAETIRSYIKRGKKLGLINKAFVKKNNSKLVSVYKGGKLVKTYISITDCANKLFEDFGIKVESRDRLYKIIKNNKSIDEIYTFKIVQSLDDIE